MTREVAGSQPDLGAAAPGVLVFDLGELRPAGVSSPPVGREPLVSQLKRFRPPPRRTALAVVVIACLAAAAGWQVGAGRTESRQAAQTQAHPPALAWLTFLASSASGEPGRPHTVLDLNIINLGSSDLRVTGVVSRTAAGTAQVQLRPNPTVVAAPGETAHRILDVRSSCTTPFVDASLQVDLRFGGEGERSTPAHILAAYDGSVGIPYPDILRVLCSTSDRSSPGGLSGVYVQQTSSAGRATLVLTNRSAYPREVQLRSLEAGSFAVVTDPRTPLVLGPGRSTSVLLRVNVRSCAGAGRLSNWADGVSLRIQPQDGGGGDADGATELGLRDALLAPAGAAVQRTCR